MKLLPTFSLLLLHLLFFQNIFGQSNDSFFKPLQINEVYLKTTPKNWQYVLDSLYLNDESFLLADMEYKIGSSTQKYTLNNVGFRYHAYRGFTPGDKFNPLEIKLNQQTSDQHIELHQLLQFSHALRDPSMLREVIGYSIWRTFAPAPRANFVKVYVNDQFYGLMVNIEAIDHAFLKSNFGDQGGTLYRSNPNLEQVASAGCKKNIFGSLLVDASADCLSNYFINETNTDWASLFQLSNLLNTQPDKLEQTLEIDQTLWMLALNNALVNLNSYSGLGSPNYYLYKDEKNIFHPIVGNLNLGFGTYKNTGMGSDLSIEELKRLDPLLHIYNVEKPMMNQILKNDLHRKTYLAHIRTIMEQYFWNGQFNKQVDSLYQIIQPILASSSFDLARFKESLYTTTGTKSFVPGLISFMDERAKFLKKHPSLTVLPSEITNINLTKRLPYSSKRIDVFEVKANINRYPRIVKLFYRFDDTSPYQELSMHDDGAAGDETENDDIFTVRIVPPAGQVKLNYYIFVENAGAVSFAPDRYMYQSFTTSLEELNK